MISSEGNAGAGAHVVILAFNALTQDTRILKQVETLTRAGYKVTGLALTDDANPGHDLGNSNQHIYRVTVALGASPPPADTSPLCARVYGGAVGDLLGKVDEARGLYKSLRRAISILRVGAFLHLSARKRAEERLRLKTLRLRLREALFSRFDGSHRLGNTLLFETAVRQFCETSPEWQARIAALGPPQLVHAHDLYTLSGGALLAEQYNAKLIYDAHEYEPERMPPLPQDQRKVITTFEDWLLAQASGLVTVSESIAGLYRRRHPELNVRLVQNCPDLRNAVNDVPGLRQRTGLGPDVPLIVFVGLPKLDARGLQVTLDVLALLPEAALAIIGPRREALDQELMVAVRGAGLEGRVHLLEPVAPQDVITAIRDADVSACLIQDATLSYRFSMPNKLFEALLAGVPTIVSDFPDMGELMRRLNAGLVVDQTDPQAIADAVRQILANRDAFVPSGGARAELEKSCSWEGQESVLMDLYRGLVSDSDAGTDRTRS